MNILLRKYDGQKFVTREIEVSEAEAAEMYASRPGTTYMGVKKHYCTYDYGTPSAVMAAIEAAYTTETRIRVWYSYDGEVSDDQYQVSGYVGRSTGSGQPLFLFRKRSYSGDLINTRRISRIMDTDTKVVLYEEPGFKMPVYESRGDGNVFRHGTLIAHFDSIDKANRWIAAMTGKRGNF